MHGPKYIIRCFTGVTEKIIRTDVGGTGCTPT